MTTYVYIGAAARTKTSARGTATFSEWPKCPILRGTIIPLFKQIKINDLQRPVLRTKKNRIYIAYLPIVKIRDFCERTKIMGGESTKVKLAARAAVMSLIPMMSPRVKANVRKIWQPLTF